MKPILFPPEATQFDTNGLGRVDCLSCYVTEERNGQYELSIEAPATGSHISEIGLSSILVVRHDDTEDLQPLRVYDIKNNIKGKVTIYARHIAHDTDLNPVMPFNVPATPTSCGRTLELLRFNATEPCPFSFWTDVTTVASYQQPTPASMWQRLKGTQGSVLDQFGGEYEWDKWTIKLHKMRGRLDPVASLRYGKNIIDLDQEKNIANTVTGVCPFWTNAEGDLVTLPEKVIESEYADLYPFKRTIPLDLSQEYESKPTEAQLRSSARAYINQANIGHPDISIKVSFVPLWQTEEYRDIAPLQRVRLCDYVNIDFEKLGISEKAKVVKTKFDVLKERYDSIELGSVRPTIANTINSLSGAISAETSRNIFALRQTSNELKGDIANATAWLTGSNGYVMAVKNEDGTWKELLFLDHPDAAEAIRVLRINENGIGFSSNGVAGPYTQAWTLDGKMVIGGTNVPSLTVYKQNGAVLFRISADGIEWSTPNSSMFPSGSLVIRGGSSVDGETITGTIDGSREDLDVTNIDGGNITGTINGNNTTITNINGGNIKTGTIVADAISTGAITAAKLATNAVTANKINANAVTADKINASAVTAGKIAANAVTSDKINASAVTAGKIAANAVTSDKINASAVTAGKIAAGAVTADKINAGAVTADKINAGAVTAEKIGAKAVSGDKVSGGEMTAIQSIGFDHGAYFDQKELDDNEYVIRSWGRRFKAIGAIVSQGNTRPTDDGKYNCGTDGHHWNQVYAKKAEINTSDIKNKHNIQPIGEKYEQLFMGIKPVTYMLNGGDRIHIGAIAQQVKEAMDAAGLEDADLSAYCRSQHIDTVEYDRPDGVHVVNDVPAFDEHGNPIYDYGLRYGEFTLLNTHMIQKLYQRIHDLEMELAEIRNP